MNANNILFSVIGIIFITIAGLGGYVVNKEFFSNSATAITETNSSDILGEGMQEEGLVETSLEDSIAPETQNQLEQKTITECVTVRVDDDDDDNEYEDDDDDAKTKEVCTTRVIEVVATPSQTEAVVTPSTSPAPLPTAPTQAPTPTPTIASYTMAEVKTHNSASSCWSVINGSVYNLTSFVSQHPGGSSAIKSLCGVDGTSAYNGQHGSSKRPANELASLKIGILK